MNPAAEARAKVLEAHPEAEVVERRRNSIKHQLSDAPDGKQRFALDVAIGPFHYGDDQEIDTALIPSTAPWDWEMTKAGFEVRALSRLDAGQVIEYRSGSEWVRFQPMALQYSNDLNQIQQIAMLGAVDAAVDDDTLTWTDGYGPGRSLSWQAQTARLAKLLTIQSLSDLPAVQQFILDGGNPVLELNLIFAHSGGVTPYVNGQEWKRGDRDTQGLVEFRDDQGNVLWWFNLPRSWDSESNEQLGTFRFKKQGNSLYVSHRVPLSFVQGAVYPLMVDVTVDEQVGANGDDVQHREFDTHNFFDGSTLRFGSVNATNDGYGTYTRFTTVAIGQADTIDVAYITYTPRVGLSATTCNVDVQADDADDTTAPTDDTEYDALVLTTAKTDWDNLPQWVVNIEQDSPSIVSVVQEVVDRGSWSSGNAMAIITHDEARASSDEAYRDATPHNNDSAKAPKLHVEYTAAGVTTRRYSLTLTGVG